MEDVVTLLQALANSERRPKDLEGLPYGLDTNPENASWAPMKLYRRVDVVERALARWKSRARLEAELKRRALR